MVRSNGPRTQTHKSRARGYNFEHQLSLDFNDKNWNAQRLGGTTVKLPDILATNDELEVILSIEAKVTTTNNAHVPLEELERCLKILTMFKVYKTRTVILAFKFNQKRILKPDNPGYKNGQYFNRPVQYYYFKLLRIENLANIKAISCNYQGKLRIVCFNKELKKDTKVEYDTYYIPGDLKVSFYRKKLISTGVDVPDILSDCALT